MIDDSQLEPSDKIPVEPSEEAIRLRSQQIWEREGGSEGYALEHWMRAKAELEAEPEHWMRVKAELEAEMEKTSTTHLAALVHRKNDFVRSILAQAGAMMLKASRLMARFTDSRAHREAWYDDIEKGLRALSRENITFARRSNESAPARLHLLPLATAKRSKQTSAAPSIICADIFLHGTLESTGDIQLDGRVEGNVLSARLVVGDEAVIQGEVIADDVTVRGSIWGSIRARKVLLRSGARVEGDILYGIFAAEAGAQFEGYCRYVDDPLSQENAPAATCGPVVSEDTVEADTPSEEAPLSQTAA
jgi:cytoskeletal protein CcmA (bactofilin family)